MHTKGLYEFAVMRSKVVKENFSFQSVTSYPKRDVIFILLRILSVTHVTCLAELAQHTPMEGKKIVVNLSDTLCKPTQVVSANVVFSRNDVHSERIGLELKCPPHQSCIGGFHTL